MTHVPSPRIDDCVLDVSSWDPTAAGSALDSFEYIDLSAVDQDLKAIAGARSVLRSEAPSRARKLVRSGDILVSTVRPNLNGVAMVPPELDGATASTGFCVLRAVPETLEPRYLFHWVKTPEFIARMVKRATGASYPAVSDRIVLDSRIPLPPLPKQRRIAAVLDKADELRTKRREALVQLDRLAQSIFVEMFGDPAKNPKSWPIRTLKELGRVSTGGTPPSAMEGMFGGDIPFVTPGDLESDHPVRRTVTEAGAQEAGTVRAGASLVCCIGATIGKMGTALVRSSFNQQLNAVEWFEQHVDDAYGLAALRFFKPTIIAWGASTTLPILKKSSFEKISIPTPPIAMQREFAGRVRAISRLEAKLRGALERDTALFGSLQSSAFQGGL